MTAVFVDLHGHVEDVDLLDDLDRFGIGQVQMAAAAGAGVEEVVGGDRGEHLGREELALVGGMSRLAAALASRLAGRRLRLGRLDDVGGRRLGRVGGVLQGRGELLLQLLDDGLEGDELGAKSSTSTWSRWQLAHGGVASAFMVVESIRPATMIQHCERLPLPPILTSFPEENVATPRSSMAWWFGQTTRCFLVCPNPYVPRPEDERDAPQRGTTAFKFDAFRTDLAAKLIDLFQTSCRPRHGLLGSSWIASVPEAA